MQRFFRKNNTLLATTYCLHLYISKPKKIRVGKLGTFSFQRGNYLYIGSARKNLTKRIERHLRKKKKKFWHIDYLLQYAEVRNIWVGNVPEEEIAASLSKKLKIPVKKFGASDKKSKAHLFYCKRMHESYFSGIVIRNYSLEISRDRFANARNDDVR